MRAIILFGHGARDGRWRKPFDRLSDLWIKQNPDIPVQLAFLEMMRPTLMEAINALNTQGATKVIVVPVFFGQGGHLRNDFPMLIADCRKRFSKIDIGVTDAVGEDLQVLQSIVDFSKRNCIE